MTTCGYVALVMCSHDNAGRPMDLNIAAKVVSEMNGTYDRFFWHSLLGNKLEVREMKATAGQVDVKKCFREYQSVAHICAASVAASEYLEPRLLGSGPIKLLACGATH